jgi:midasin
VACCFAESFPGNQLEDMLSLCGTAGTLSRQLELLQQSSSEELKTLVRRSFQDLDPASPGAAWLSLSHLLLSLVVPNIPIDPARIQNARRMRLREEETYLNVQINLHSRLEILTTGHGDNDLITYLTSKLGSVHDELAGSPSIDAARDIDRLHQFWAEVTQFSTSVIHPSKIAALANLAKSNAAIALLQEQVIQESIAGFQHRLETLYDDFSDIVRPIKLAILQFRLGLRLLLSVRDSRSNISHQFASSVMAFPTSACVNQLVSHVDEIPNLGLGASTSCLLPLSAIAYDVAAGNNIKGRVQELASLYERLFSMWSIDQARSREVEQQANSLYRQNKTEHLAMTDAELEAQEFLELFPQFEAAVESTQNSEGSSPDTPLITPDHMAILATLHVSVFHGQQYPQGSANLLWKLRRNAVDSLLHSPSIYLPSQLDLLSRPFQLSLLEQITLPLAPAHPATLSKLPNFYTECHVSEVKILVPLVERMHKRIEALLLEWPDQEVLHHLSGCCRKVLELDLYSPVAKALAEVEQLLLQSEDWEIYANRDNSLKSYREEMTSLIVRWRQLELSSWSTLLTAESTRAESAACVWWFRLYDLVVRGVLSAAAEVASKQRSSGDEYLATLIPLAKEFITSSPLGEYQARMHMLLSFAQYLSTWADVNDAETRTLLRRVSQVLAALHLYLESYSAKLSSHLATERSKLEAEIRNFIKLASWKDINIVALKQSAQKSHHQLYKVVRKFRELLKQPVTTWITPQFLGDSPLAQDSPTIWPALAPSPSVPPSFEASSIEHLRNLERTYKRFEAILEQDIRSLVRSSPHALPDDMACEIVASSRRLASLTCPANLDKEKRSKFLKSIQSQKRRAWSDMLKELKRAGFSYNTKADVTRDNYSQVWIYTQPRASREPVPDPIAGRSEQYFHELQGCLPSLRLSLSRHHSDLSTRDASRGLALAENIFHAAVTLRSRSVASGLRFLQSLIPDVEPLSVANN